MTNLLYLANAAIAGQKGFDGHLSISAAKKSYYDANFPNDTMPGVGKVTQANMQVTMTPNGIRLYSPPNWDGRSISGSGWDTWGGLCLSPMKTSNCLIKGHRYIIMWYIKGQTSVAMEAPYWSNYIGWGQSPDASPTVNGRCIPGTNFQGEMDCYYDFTINDDVFKTTGDSVHSGFEANTTYLAYAALKIGFGYRQTGELGTDLYLTNFRMYDITNGKQDMNINKEGQIILPTIMEPQIGTIPEARIEQSGDFFCNNIIEF